MSRSRRTNQAIGERSFTLFETIVAISILASIIFEVSAVQANSIVFSEYERRSTQAIWFAKGIMSKIEYEWHKVPFKEMENAEHSFKDKKVESDIIIDEEDFYTYDVDIKEWKLPLIDILTGGGKGGDDDDGGGEGDIIRSQLKKFLGDDILKTATVTVYWPEGAIRNSIRLTLLLTNQRKLDETIKSLPPIKKPKKKKKKKKKKKPARNKKLKDKEAREGDEEGREPPEADL